jgi:uncharacterized damage-inducible protein DinB
VPRTALDTLAWLLDEAFEGSDHSLIENLRDVGDAEWSTPPPGGERSIASIIEHVGWAKWMYENYAFGDASLHGDEPPMVTADQRPRPRGELMEWLREGHRRLDASVRALDDDGELERLRLTNWGERQPTRWIVRVLIAHDLYHAGEINHLRALLQGDDRWPYG